MLLVTVLAGLAATRLQMDPNVLVLLPEDEPTAQAIHRLNEEEGGANLLTVTVRGDDPEALDAFMVGLRDAMAGSERVDYALYDLDPELAWRVGVLQLTPEELTLLEGRLQAALSLGPAAANPFLSARLLDLGPLTEKLARSPDQASFASAGEGLRRLVIRPNSTPYDPAFSRALMAELDGHIARLDPASQGLEVVWIGGAYRHSVEDVRNLTKDLGWTGAVSFFAVLCLIAVAFRDLRAILLVFVPLIAANVWTAGYAGAVIGKLNTFTSFFPAVLIGLGVDFSIHLYSRFREEQALGGTVEDAVVRAWDRAGPPCFTAGLTTAGGFCALWVAGFQGFQQLGTILAGGVVFCLTAVVLGLPVLILWREKRAPAQVRVEASVDLRPTRPPTYRYAPLMLLLVGIGTIGAATVLPRVSFEFDLSELRPKGLSYGDLDDTRRMLARESAAPVVVSFDSEAELLAAHRRVAPAVASGAIPEMSAVVDRFSLLPEDQDQRLAQLGAIADLARNENVRYLPLPVQKNLSRIAGAELEPLSVADLPRGARHMLGASDGHHRMMILPAGNLWDVRQNRKLFEAVQEWLPGESAAGEYLALAVLFELMQGDTPRVAGVALGLVLLFSLIDLRSVPRAVGALAALLAGMTWAGAAMVGLDLKLSLVNFVGVPILMGIGVDVVIHLLHRLAEEGPGRVGHALRTTGWASGLSAATTIFSFAALSVATAEGIRSLGLLIVMGLSLVAAAGLTLVPLGWMTAWKVGGDLPRDAEGGEE